MSKSILVIDTPKSCRECHLFKSEYHSYTLEHFMMCKVNGKLNIGKDYATKCHPQCPLQDTTELLEALEKLKKYPLLPHSEFEAYNKLHKALGGINE